MRKLEGFIAEMAAIYPKIEDEETKCQKALEQFEREYRKANGKTLQALEAEQKAIRKKYGMKEESVVFCEDCGKFYHMSQLKKWLWTGSDPEDDETIVQCPFDHQGDFYELDTCLADDESEQLTRYFAKLKKSIKDRTRTALPLPR